MKEKTMHMHRGPSRESGFATIYTMILVTFLMALASAVTILCNVGLRAGGDSRRSMEAFYLADSGAQIAGAALRASNGTLLDTIFTEPIGAGDTAVAITAYAFGEIIQKAMETKPLVMPETESKSAEMKAPSKEMFR